MKFNQLLHLNSVFLKCLINYFAGSNICKLLFVVTKADKLLHYRDSHCFKALQTAKVRWEANTVIKSIWRNHALPTTGSKTSVLKSFPLPPIFF